jgi:hypothetical protein
LRVTHRSERNPSVFRGAGGDANGLAERLYLQVRCQHSGGTSVHRSITILNTCWVQAVNDRVPRLAVSDEIAFVSRFLIIYVSVCLSTVQATLSPSAQTVSFGSRARTNALETVELKAGRIGIR